MRTNLLHDPNLEKGVVWYLMQTEINDKMIPEAIKIFRTANPFYHKLYRQVYDGILQLYRNNSSIHLESIDQYFFKKNDVFLTPEERDLLEDSERWNKFLIFDPKSEIDRYIEIFKENALNLLDIYMKREIQRLGAEMQSLNGTSGIEICININSKLAEIKELSQQEDIVNYGINSHINKMVKKLEVVATNDGILGISTGFDSLDMYLSGIQKGEYTIIAGRPAMGKSTLSYMMLYNMAQRGEKCAIISYEMNCDSILHKFFASELNIDSNLIRNGTVVRDENLCSKFTMACNKIYQETKDNLFILTSVNPDIDPLVDTITYLADNDNIEVFVIDHLQKLTCNRILNNGGNRVQQVGSISDSLQKLSRKKNIAIIAISQLSRSCDQRQDKRPYLSDLRESGDIEQDADNVLFLYRDAEYSGNKDDKTLEIIIAKQRNGPTGTAYFYYDKAVSRITPIERRHSK